MFYPYAFEAPLLRHSIGKAKVLVYTAVFLPPSLAAELPFRGGTPLRVEGEIADVPFVGAFQSSHGQWYLMVGKPVLSAAGVAVGEIVTVRFRADQKAVDLPDALGAALAADAAAGAAWAALSPGRKRGLAHRVASAKAPATVARRVEDVLAALSGDGSEGRKSR